MIPITGTNSWASLIVIVGMLWYLLSAWLLRKYYSQKYTHSLKSRIEAIFVVGKLLLVNDIKNDKKLNQLIWSTRLSIVAIIVGVW